MPYTIRVFTENEKYYEITEPIKSINWKDDLDNVHISFNFVTSAEIDINQYVGLFEEDSGKYVWRGLVTYKELSSETKLYHYIGYDAGFYFEKNATTVQFINASILHALSKICSDVQIRFLAHPNSLNNYRVTKIYTCKNVALIAKNLLEIAQDKGFSKNTYIDCCNGGLNIFNYAYRDDLSGLLANTFLVRSTDTIQNYKISSSMNDLKNSLVAVDNNQKLLREQPYYDTESIKRFGFLQDIYTLDNDDKNDYDQLTHKKLNQLSKVQDTINLTMLGDCRMRKGVVIPINIGDNINNMHLTGNYLIKSSEHTIKGAIETVDVFLKLFDEELKEIKNINEDERFL